MPPRCRPMPGQGLEPWTRLIKSQVGDEVTQAIARDLQQFLQQRGEGNAQLASLLAVWSSLRPSVRASLASLAQAAVGTRTLGF